MSGHVTWKRYGKGERFEFRATVDGHPLKVYYSFNGWKRWFFTCGCVMRECDSAPDAKRQAEEFVKSLPKKAEVSP